MKNIMVGLLLIWLTTLNCNAIKEFKLQADSECHINSITILPFNYVKKLLIIDATIQTSSESNKFIFDTGAHQSKIEFDLAQAFKLKTITSRNNGTSQGIKRKIEITNLDSIKIKNATFINIAAGKLKYDSKSYSPCIAEDGIIGANLIQLAHWKINYDKKLITISKSPIIPSPDKGLIQVDFYTSFLSGVPKIDIEIEGQLIRDVVFDMGYNGGLIVPYKYAKTFPSSKTQVIIDHSTTGIFGSTRDRLLIKELSVQLAEFETILPVEFSSLNKRLLGNDFLEHFTIYLNYKQDKITLVPLSPLEIDPLKKFIPGVINDSLWIVNRTSPTLPIELGDTLRSINGYQPQHLYESHCDYFFNISELLNEDILLVETINRNQFQLKKHK